MNGTMFSWNSGLLFAALCVLLGTIGVVAAGRTEDRCRASGLVLQGILLTFIVGGSYFHSSSNLHLGALAVLGLLIIQTIVTASVVTDDMSNNEDKPA